MYLVANPEDRFFRDEAQCSLYNVAIQARYHVTCEKHYKKFQDNDDKRLIIFYAEISYQNP